MTDHPRATIAAPANLPMLQQKISFRGINQDKNDSSSARNNKLMSAVCVQARLAPLLERRQAALERCRVIREECRQWLPHYQAQGQRLSELSFESQHLRKEWAAMGKKCATRAVQLAAKVVENDERNAQHNHAAAEKFSQLLERLFQAVCGGALSLALDSATDQVRRLRFLMAVRVFDMFRIDVEHHGRRNKENSRDSSGLRHLHARGIGKICGLPLPNAGPDLYVVLPQNELNSALRLVACLTSTVARCLGIVLPHPILLTPNETSGDITDTVANPKTTAEAPPPPPPAQQSDLSESTTSLLSLIGNQASIFGRSAKNVIARSTGQQMSGLDEMIHSASRPSMDAAAVSRRLLHARAAVIAEDRSVSSSRYTLSLSSKGAEDEFAIGLQLLQNNVVALCMRAEVPVANLWPAGAILLNMHALWVHCRSQVIQCNDSTAGEANQ